MGKGINYLNLIFCRYDVFIVSIVCVRARLMVLQYSYIDHESRTCTTRDERYKLQHYCSIR